MARSRKAPAPAVEPELPGLGVNPFPQTDPNESLEEQQRQKAQMVVDAEDPHQAAKDMAKEEVSDQTSMKMTAEERAANAAARADRIAALNPDGKRTYVGTMLALADRVKQGAYVKGSTGQLRSQNELAVLLDDVPVDNVIALARIVLEVEENPYANLNTGQQSMNFRNRMRGAISKGTLTLETVKKCIEENDFATAGDWPAIKAQKAKERAEASQKAKAEKAEKLKANPPKPLAQKIAETEGEDDDDSYDE